MKHRSDEALRQIGFLLGSLSLATLIRRIATDIRLPSFVLEIDLSLIERRFGKDHLQLV